MNCLPFVATRVGCNTERLALRLHLLHDHAVVFLQVVSLNDALKRGSILAAGSIACLLQTSSPSLVVVRGELEKGCVSLVLFQKLGVVLVGVSHRSILTELLIRTVVGIDKVLASILNPTGGSLDTEMIVALTRQFTLSACALADALCQGNRSRYAIAAHLLHGILCILLYVFFVL